MTGDARLLAALDDAAAQRAVVVRAERDLDGGDRQQLERLVELRPADVREAGAAHEAVVDEPGQRAHARLPRGAGIGRVQQVDVDRQAVQGGRGSPRSRRGSPARGRRGPRPTPARAIPPLVTMRAPLRRAGAAQPARQQRLVVAELALVAAVGVRGVEERHARLHGGSDGRQRALLVAVGGGREAHAPQADAQLGDTAQALRTTAGRVEAASRSRRAEGGSPSSWRSPRARSTRSRALPRRPCASSSSAQAA